jgi:flavin reductase (DIM6/NTAB) family NADH-FMN oxidoreductase RutF
MAMIPYDTKDVFDMTVRRMTKDGLLLVTADKKGKPNVMTIGWGTIGSVWGKEVFIILVRPSRYSHTLLEQTGEFTVNVPTQGLASAAAFCGSVSGRDCDKFAQAQLTPVPAEEVSVPVIEQCPINYQCRVIHKTDMVAGAVPSEVKGKFYPSGDYHRIYFGQILACYADENLRILS